MFNQNFSNEFTETRIAVTVIPSHLANMSTISTSGSTVFQEQRGFGGGKHVKTPTTTTYLCLHFCLACVMMSFLYVMKKREVEENYHDKGCDFNLFLAICFRLKRLGECFSSSPNKKDRAIQIKLNQNRSCFLLFR